MKPATIFYAILLALLAACRGPAQGEELSLNTGTFGVGDTEELFVVGAEYRAKPVWEGVRPIVGASLLEDGGNYVYAGARYDWDVADRWQLSPSLAAGIYSAESLDLGGPVEFRSGLDAGYRLNDDWKIAVGFYHLSNGGIYSENGGSEALLLSLTHIF